MEEITENTPPPPTPPPKKSLHSNPRDGEVCAAHSCVEQVKATVNHVVNSMSIDLVTSAEILGLNSISNDLKWNCHIDSIVKEAKERLYSLSQLKRSGLGARELVQFFCTFIRPITEYACPAFHDGLPVYLSNDLEGVQKRAMRNIFPLCYTIRPWLNQA